MVKNGYCRREGIRYPDDHVLRHTQAKHHETQRDITGATGLLFHMKNGGWRM
jgi:hypothetical protein